MILLDTDVVSYIIKGQKPYFDNFRTLLPGEWGISSLVAFELQYGNQLKRTKYSQVVNAFIANAQIYSFNTAAADSAATVAASLALQGKKLSNSDVLIAGHALSMNATLISNNVKHFSRIPNLHLVDWAK